MNARPVLFDLDGTISDPSEGITKSINYARFYRESFRLEMGYVHVLSFTESINYPRFY